jgi:hypothetical protein
MYQETVNIIHNLVACHDRRRRWGLYGRWT